MTLSTTSAPLSLSRAVWTWATEAEASGVSSKSSNRASIGCIKLCSISARAWVPGRGDSVLQERQLIGQIRWQQIPTGREHLAELDEDGAQRFEGEAQTFAAAFTLVAVAQPEERGAGGAYLPGRQARGSSSSRPWCSSSAPIRGMLGAAP